MTANKTAAPVRISEFMDRDFKLFSLYDNLRSIPYLTDGFKPSQRKAVCGMLMRGENAPEIKVSQLTGQISSTTQYHHGEGSLSQTIIGMAQDYAGSNNMNYFTPNGQFGNRLCAESAADRYIFTQLSPNFRKIFKKEDDFILEPQYDDGDEIEPVTYLPVLPNVLINGSRGMGTGYACHILNYNPEDLRLAIIAELQGKKWEPLVPWYRGFQGKVYRNVTNEINPNQVVFEGVLEVVNSTTIKITELPIGTYASDYKKTLLKLEDLGVIKSFDDNSVEGAFEYIVTCPRATTMLTHAELMTKFKLISRESENVTVWDEHKRIKEFNDVNELLKHFVAWRVTKYDLRRLTLVDVLTEQVRYMSEKLRFILFYLENVDLFRNKKKPELVALLEKEKFTDISKLMSLSIWSLTYDEIEKLKKEIADNEVQIESLKNDNAKDMYLRELKGLKL